jgi:uncharacterized protein YdeI (YjbR/CyaY-like superfamily)
VKRNVLTDQDTLNVANREDWCAWLEKNHDKKKQIWLIFHKKHTGKPSIPYADAVEESLCYGWIDSLVRQVDEDTYI